MNSVESYWNNLDLDTLVRNGYIKLPSIRSLGLSSVSDSVISQMEGKNFKELCAAHKDFLKVLALDDYLAPKLFKLAKEKFGYEGLISNQYHVARKVTSCDIKEKYRAHFDSHIFTLVIPIRIPERRSDTDEIGDLIFFPNLRRSPKSEFENFIGKMWYHRYASKNGINKLAMKSIVLVEDFLDYEPLLFLGSSVFHSNKPVFIESTSIEYRLTLLSHYFDSSPKYGIGNLLRMLRNR